MLSKTDQKTFKRQTKYPNSLVVGDKLYNDIHRVNKSITSMAAYKLMCAIADKAASLEEAYQMYVSSTGSDNGEMHAVISETNVKKISDFRSRKELNNFLRRHGYTWQKTTEEDMDHLGPNAFENKYGRRDFVWELIAPDYSVVTVAEALESIAKV